MAKKGPKTINVSGCRARAVRGPDAAGRFYWRFETHRNGRDEKLCDSVWADRPTAERIIVEGVARGEFGVLEASVELVTVRDLLETFLGEKVSEAGRSRHTQAWQRSSALNVVEGLGDTRLSALDSARLREYVNARFASGAASGTVKLELQVVGTAWRWAQERRYLSPGQVPRVTVKMVAKRTKRTPRDEDVARVRAAIAARTRRRWPLVALDLMYGSGARIGELAVAVVSDFQPVDGTMVFRGKTGSRVVRLHPALADALRAWTAGRLPSEPLLGVGYTSVRQWAPRYLHPVLAELDMPRWTAHGLRRSAANRLKRAGVSIDTFAAYLGHSKRVAVEYYLQPNEDDLDKATEALAGVSPHNKSAHRGES